MSLLNYPDKAKQRIKRDFTPQEEAALFDFITREATVREAARILGRPDTGQGLYSLAVAVMRNWMDEGLIDKEDIRLALVARLERGEDVRD